MTNPSYTAVIKLTQTYSPNLLNETAFLYSGNKITLTPQAGFGGSLQVSRPAGPRHSFFPVANNVGNDMPEIDLQGAPLNANWSRVLLPMEERLRRLRVPRRSFLDKGPSPVQIRLSLAARLQEPATAGQYPGNCGLQRRAHFSGDSYINFLLGDASSFTQLQYLSDKHWVNNNYGFMSTTTGTSIRD